MEKAVKSKKKFLKFLPKAASAVTFQNPPFSPSRDKRSDPNKLKSHIGKGFSGPIISMIPPEARHKSKNSSFAAQEPTSPKISCMGQIKHKKKKICKNKHVSPRKELRPNLSFPEVKSKKKKSLAIRNIFRSEKSGGGKKSDGSAAEPSDFKRAIPDKVLSLGQMKRFASRRDTFANFDWTAQIASVESDHRNYYSDEDRGESDDEEDGPIIPFSAPILIGGGGGVALEPRKEINLWKRRTMVQPKPLQLITSH